MRSEEQKDNIVPMRQAGHGPSGPYNGLEERVREVEKLLVRLDERSHNLATKADIAEIRKVIVEREASLLRWLIGIISIALVSLTVVLVRTFISTN